jgi:hypothetical protein
VIVLKRFRMAALYYRSVMPFHLALSAASGLIFLRAGLVFAGPVLLLKMLAWAGTWALRTDASRQQEMFYQNCGVAFTSVFLIAASGELSVLCMAAILTAILN